MIQKPKLWSYKTGKKAGRLRPQSKKYLSQQLKLYHSTGLNKIQRKNREIIKEETRDFIEDFIDKRQIKKRLRKQVCYNSQYNISLRAITINNPKVTEQDLINIINEFLNSNPTLLNDTTLSTEGIELKYISSDEDSNLFENLIYIETKIHGVYELIKW